MKQIIVTTIVFFVFDATSTCSQSGKSKTENNDFKKLRHFYILMFVSAVFAKIILH